MFFDYDINSKDIKILKYIQKNKSATKQQIIKKFKKIGISTRFEMLVQAKYIDQILDYVDNYGVCHYSDLFTVSEFGMVAMENYEAENLSRLEWMLKDKTLNVAVSVITAFITSLATYFVMPHIIDFISRMLP